MNIISPEIIRREVVRLLCARHTDEPPGEVSRATTVRIEPSDYDKKLVIAHRDKTVELLLDEGALSMALGDFSERLLVPACCALLPRLPDL